MTLHPMEEATIRAFIASERRDRWLSLLGNPKRRQRLLGELGHGSRFFDGRFAFSVPSRKEAGEMLRALGAPEHCHVISDSRHSDGRELPLDDALVDASRGVGAILCCLPGTLAYYEGEFTEPRLILRRTAR